MISCDEAKVAVKHFGKKKGKGLVAKEVVEEGETIWKEDPFILAPEWYVHLRPNLQIYLSSIILLYGVFREIFDGQQASLHCDHCSTSLLPSSLPSFPGHVNTHLLFLSYHLQHQPQPQLEPDRSVYQVGANIAIWQGRVLHRIW